MITTIVFDLDDTLYNELDYCESGFAAVADFLVKKFTHFTLTGIFTALWDQFQSGNHTKTFNAALDSLGVKYDSDLVTQCVQTYRTHTPTITLPQESCETLEQLSKKYTLALLTDGYLPAQQLKVHALGIEKYFKCIIYTEQLGRQFWKPSPAGFQKLLTDLNAKPQNCVYVADNITKDFIAPNQLGFTTIQITRPTRIHANNPETSDAVPQYVIHNLTDLLSLLEGI